MMDSAPVCPRSHPARDSDTAICGTVMTTMQALKNSPYAVCRAATCAGHAAGSLTRSTQAN